VVLRFLATNFTAAAAANCHEFEFPLAEFNRVNQFSKTVSKRDRIFASSHSRKLAAAAVYFVAKFNFIFRHQGAKEQGEFLNQKTRYSLT